MTATQPDQPEFFPAFVEPALPRHATIQERFAAFHAANPWVLEEFVKLLRRAQVRGFKRVGMQFLTELIRWEHAGQTHDAASAFKINNDYASRYARLIMDVYPQYKGYITTREIRTP